MLKFQKLLILLVLSGFLLAGVNLALAQDNQTDLKNPEPYTGDKKILGQWDQDQNDGTTIRYGCLDQNGNGTLEDSEKGDNCAKYFYRDPSVVTKSDYQYIPAGWYEETVFNNWLKAKGLKQEAVFGGLGPIPIDNNAKGGLTDIVKTIIRLLLIAAFVIAVVIVIIGGYLYITAGGNPDQSSRAKNTILGAVIGIIIAFGAYAIIHFVYGVI